MPMDSEPAWANLGQEVVLDKEYWGPVGMWVSLLVALGLELGALLPGQQGCGVNSIPEVRLGHC